MIHLRKRIRGSGYYIRPLGVISFIKGGEYVVLQGSFSKKDDKRGPSFFKSNQPVIDLLLYFVFPMVFYFK